MIIYKSVKAFSEYERSLKMTTIDFIAILGGLFGLCLGFSFLSFIEIIYWMVFKLSQNLRRTEN